MLSFPTVFFRSSLAVSAGLLVAGCVVPPPPPAEAQVPPPPDEIQMIYDALVKIGKNPVKTPADFFDGQPRRRAVA